MILFNFKKSRKVRFPSCSSLYVESAPDKKVTEIALKPISWNFDRELVI